MLYAYELAARKGVINLRREFVNAREFLFTNAYIPFVVHMTIGVWGLTTTKELTTQTHENPALTPTRSVGT